MYQYQKLLDAYKLLTENIEDLTDEQIDQVIETESDLLNSLDAMIASKKFYAERKKIAEQNEKLATRVMLRIMKQLGVTEQEGENGKAKMYFTMKYVIELAKLPSNFFSVNHAKVNAELNKDVSIPGVVPTDKIPYVKVR